MKALSLWQPWASAIALGLKRVETRHWTCAYRGPLAIHAAKRWTLDEREFHAVEVEDGRMPVELPFGAVVATANLVAIERTETLRQRLAPTEIYWGNYYDGRFGWLFEDIRPLLVPVPFKGAQGLFEVPDQLLGVRRLDVAIAAPRQGLLL